MASEGRITDQLDPNAPKPVAAPVPTLPATGAAAPPPPDTSSLDAAATAAGYGSAPSAAGMGGMDIPGAPGLSVPTAPAPQNAPVPQGQPSPAGAGFQGNVDPWTAELQAASADVPYLRSPLSKTTEGQAQLEMSKQPIRQRYDVLRQQLNDKFGGSSGAMGSSGILQEEMNRLNDEQMKEESNVERVWAGQTTGRLADSRSILSGLDQARTARETAAGALESGLYGTQGQDINALLAAGLQQTPSPTDSTKLSSSMLQAAGVQDAAANQRAQATGKGMGDMASLYWMSQPKPYNPAAETPSYGTDLSGSNAYTQLF